MELAQKKPPVSAQVEHPITPQEYVEICIKKLEDCRRQWCDLPGYVYTKEYKEAFRAWCEEAAPKRLEIIPVERQTVDALSLTIMTLDHETGGREPYFEFRRN
jgi:hypothetical protein